MTAPEIVVQLVERFERNLDDYRLGKYNETQVRIEFVGPLFKALGWDVDNEQGHAERYKDVIHEDAVKIGGSMKAPDYSFRIGGLRKFFVEAKKPSVNLKDDTAPAYQVRRYAWSAKLPVSILTDFEEFAVYDCRNRPAKTDNAATGRVMYLKYKDYIDQWDMLYETYSREAVLKGAFDKFVGEFKTARGTQEVDAAFLTEIERWRDELARNLALRNEALNQRQLNFAVQRTIDRIIFLRIAEDRGIEPYQQLGDITQAEDIYQNLMRLFQRADDRYNSGLFHFKEEKRRGGYPDYLTPALKLDNRVLKGILSNLYYPDSPYEFSVLPAEILGQVYEQFLGKVIRLTAGHQAKVEEKPEVKKAGGVYYTPAYIVEYIVKNTVGKLVEGKTPRQANNIRILDPACGSGSFLLGAYQYLLDWHLDYYLGSEVKSHKNRIVQVGEGDHRLTTEERKRILLNNIYGVDIDSQAVEVTKLSLLLKVLEGETQQQLELIPERVLPDLGNNVKCGNSLIGPDFYEGEQMGMFEMDAEERLRINAFNWDTEFTEIMRAGGFDAVIGNPPYLRIQGLQEYYGNQIDYFIRNFTSAVKRFDLYLLFAEKGYKLLTKNGLLGFICPHKFINSDFGSGIRKFFIENKALKSYISFGNTLVFNQASTYTGILLLEKTNTSTFSYYEFSDLPSNELPEKLIGLEENDFSIFDLINLSDNPWILTSKEVQVILSKLSQQVKTLKNIVSHILVGVQSGIDNIHVMKVVEDMQGEKISLFSEKANETILIERRLVKPFLTGEDVKRYQVPKHSYYCIYPYKIVEGKTRIINENELKKLYPLGYAYLNEYRKELTDIRIRQKTNPNYWYSCHRSRDMNVFEKERIITPEISLGCNMTIVAGGIYSNTMVYSLLPSKSQPENILFWLGILNSPLMWWFLSNTGNILRGGYFRFKTNYLRPFPIRTINFDDPADKAQHDMIVSLVESMLSLHKQLAAAATPHEQTALQRQIDATDKQIDGLVYELYGLTEEEIGIVEEGVGGMKVGI